MDYGQLAYIKAEEIEAYLRNSEKNAEKRNTLRAAFYPRCAIQGGYAPCSLYGSGAVGLTVVLMLSAPQGCDGEKVRLYCGDMAAAYTTVTLGAGDRAQFTLLASVYPSDTQTLCVRSEGNSLLLEEMEILADGNDVTLTSSYAGCKSDCLDGKAYLLCAENGYIYLHIAGDGQKTDVGHGNVFDIVATPTALCVVYADDNGNLWGVTYTAALEETKRVYLGDAPQRVAVGRDVGGLRLAGIWERKVYFCLCAEDFTGRTEWAQADFATEADDVYFGKQTTRPVLFLRRGGGLYAKLPLPKTESRAAVCVAPAVTLL